MGTHFFWDPVEDNIIQERDDTGAVTADYTTEPYLYGELVSQRRGGESGFYCFDGQGSTHALTDLSGTVTDTYAYTAFGQITESTGSSDNPFQYIGQKQYYRNGRTGEYQVREAPFSPVIGRWLTLYHGRGVSTYANVGILPILPPVIGIPFLPVIRICQTTLSIKVGDHALKEVDCGEIAFQNWDFQIDFIGPDGKSTGAPCDGFIVQNVEYSCSALACDRTRFSIIASELINYFEAWFVKAGDRRPDIRKARNAIDTARFPVPRGSRGLCHQKGEVRFYCIDKAKDPRALPPPGSLGIVGTGDLRTRWRVGDVFGAAPCDITAGILPSRRFDLSEGPDFWNAAALAGPVSRDLFVRWCCCGSKKDDFAEAEASPSERADEGSWFSKRENAFLCLPRVRK